MNISVLDSNDHTPVFKGSHRLYINETAQVGHDLVTLEAEDIDLGENSVLTYSVLSNQQLFSIDAATGALQVYLYLK